MGYSDEEFPEWWYSPARPPTKKQEAPRTEDEDPRASPKDSDELTAPPPKDPVTPAPRESESKRPPLRDLVDSTRVPSADLEADRDSSVDGLNDSEINLLGSQDIVRGEDGVWVHIETEPSGRTIIARARFISRNVICVGMLVRSSAMH